MAVIKLGPMIADIRNSIGGTTFARNRAGHFARQRVKPVDMASERQQAVRNAVATLQNDWRTTLTATQRAGWNNLGDVGGGSNALGDRIRLTGIQCYIRTNVIMLLAGESQITDAPPVPYEIGIPTLVFSATVATGLKLDSITPALNAGDILQIQVSGKFSPTRSFFKGPWPVIAWIDSTATPPLSLTGVPPYVDGDRYFVAARLVTATGRVSVINRFELNVIA